MLIEELELKSATQQMMMQGMVMITKKPTTNMCEFFIKK